MGRVGSQEFENKQRRRGDRDDDDERGELPSAPLRDDFVRPDILRPLHALRRHLERPRDDERDRKSEEHQHDYRGRDSIRQMKGGDDRRRDLHHQPADDGIRDGDFVNVAPLQLGEERT